ncbi:MAG: hypothetical protein R3Y22_05230 [Bacteroidales bacterium]
MSVIVLSIAITAILYILLSIPSIQNSIKERSERELSELLDVKLNIESVSISPFNKIELYDINIPDTNGNHLARINKLGVGISIYNLIRYGQLVLTYAEIIGLDANIYKQTPDADLNIQFIIDALSSKDKDKDDSKIELKLYNIVIRQGNIKYDVLSEPRTYKKFNPNHIKITNLRADISLPHIKKDDIYIRINRLAFNEISGFKLRNLKLHTTITSEHINIEKLILELPNSVINPEPFNTSYSSLKLLSGDVNQLPTNLTIKNSYITPSDLEAIVPAFKEFNEPISINIKTSGELKQIEVKYLALHTMDNLFNLNITGTIFNSLDNNNRAINIPYIRVDAEPSKVAILTSYFSNLTPDAKNIITNCGYINFNGSMIGVLPDIHFIGDLRTSLGGVSLDSSIKIAKEDNQFSGIVKTDKFNLGQLINKSNIIDELACDIELIVQQKERILSGSINGDINYIDINGYRYKDIISNVVIDDNSYSGEVNILDDNISLDIKGFAYLAEEQSKIDLIAKGRFINFDILNISHKYPKHLLSFDLDATITGNQIDNSTGKLAIDNIHFVDHNNKGININKIKLTTQNDTIPQLITLDSDMISGKITGEYEFRSITKDFLNVLSGAFPEVIHKYPESNSKRSNIFNYSFTIHNNNQLTDFFNTPIRFIHPITIDGEFNDSIGNITLCLDAPYITQKGKLVEKSNLSLILNNDSNLYQIKGTTLLHRKKGNLTLNLDNIAHNNRVNSNINWDIEDKNLFCGNIQLSSLLSTNDNNEICSKIDINPSELIFNDTIWNINPATIDISPKYINLSGIKIDSQDQFVKINGIVSENDSDKLNVALQNFNLDYLFKTLNISNVTFGGIATGEISASSLLDDSPKITTPKIDVKNLSYNGAILGDGVLKSTLRTEDMGIFIDADIKQPNELHSYVSGVVFPTRDSLRFDFNTNKVNVAFLQPFLQVVSSDIRGEATGQLTLFGTLHNVDLEGELFADNFDIKIDYLNTYYSMSDSLVIKPGNIRFDNITINDKFGNNAKLNGEVNHRFLKDIIFNFAITEANNFLAFDLTPKLSPDWYGTLFGNGSVLIEGDPEKVNINVNMLTSSTSKFTFVLSNTLAANDYNFLTFTDKRKEAAEKLRRDALPDFIVEFNERIEKNANLTSELNVDIQVEVDPQAQMILVMDPDAGDHIDAQGTGNLRINYNSRTDNITMFGAYTLSKGNYSFSLQDIIIKNFAIKEGSTLSFNGDPTNAQMDIDAYYSLTANLSDLDESFSTDSDLTRTTVPVHAIIELNGNIQEPGITFDLDFPTLEQDIYRKVMSIVNTEDMMNQQIIYLLALNRFYTPDYASSSTSRNELASVASSTISSQLSNMLGSINENFSISPDLRTDAGDFSDIEVDVALSSQLLNNRLLLNGNFGYRDQSLNNSSSNFIGDFDVEYLLTKSGNLRLKAYNHYNENNYYLNNALNTQGVGIMVKYEFDKIFNRKEQNSQSNEPVNTERTDSIIKNK